MAIRTKSIDNRSEILAVEDSPTQALELKYILEQRGYTVTLARDGKQALSRLNGYKPALVISDINMPEMNGYQLCQRLKADENTRHIPVILLTSLSDIEDVIEGLACGADSFISKPYSNDSLLMHVQRMLADKSPRPNGSAGVEVQIGRAGQSRLITADPQRMVNLLVTVFEAAIHRNVELAQTQAALRSLNERLEDLVAERTAVLSAEIAGREQLQMELHALSLRDELTGLYNRRGFMTLAEQHWRLAQRTRQDFALLYMDVNDFKHINDTLGHAHGDLALAAVTRVLKQTFRDSDILARFGGDEFIVLCTDCDLASSWAATARLNVNFGQTNANAAGLDSLSLSVGHAQFDPNTRAGIKDLMEQADADMYANKRRLSQGRGG
jgi:diguanylate cyclase (GGDEF)-like protein